MIVALASCAAAAHGADAGAECPVHSPSHGCSIIAHLAQDHAVRAVREGSREFVVSGAKLPERREQVSPITVSISSISSTSGVALACVPPRQHSPQGTRRSRLLGAPAAR